MHGRSAAAIVAALFFSPLASADEAPSGYPTVLGDHVDPFARSHWPVRVRSLERIAWRFSEGEHAGMPVPGPDGLVYVQAGGGGVRAVEAATGKRAWIGHGHWQFFNYSSCVVGPDGAAYGGNFGFVSAMERDGKVRWTVDLDASWIHRPPALSPDGKRLYLGGDNLGIACLDAATGRVIWLRRDFRSPWTPYVFDASGSLIASIGERVVCFAPDGKELWTIEGASGHLMMAGPSLVSASGPSIESIDSDSRSRQWKLDLGADVAGLALGDDGRIVAALVNGEIASVSPAGRLRWRKKISDAALARPVSAAGGDILVCDGAGVLFLCDSNGDVVSRIDTGGAPYRWRPAVGRDGRVYLSHANDVVCIDGAEREPARPLVATDIAVVADDFVVDVWLRGRNVPLAQRHMVGERFGATTENVSLDVREGDWVVFHVVANRLRWGGASYFAARGTDAAGTEAFVSRRDLAWCACDEPGDVPAFLAARETGSCRAAVCPGVPWSGAPDVWRSLLRAEFTGEPLWGTAASTWLKFVVPSAPPVRAP